MNKKDDDCTEEVQSFIPIKVSDKVNPITFRATTNSNDNPLFQHIMYCVQPISTNNTLTIDLAEINRKLSEELQPTDFYICSVHGILDKPDEACEYCVEFANYKHTYIIKTRYYYLTFPPPDWYSPKVFNFLRTFCYLATTHSNTKEPSQEDKAAELRSYALFIDMDYKDGPLHPNTTGKTSIMRNKCLGFHTCGGRATLSIDSTLSPQYALLPQAIYDKLSLACPLVIINRAPSIKNTCIYSVHALRNSDPNDYTIKMNSYITEGLHADQDGDELTIFYLKHPKTNKPNKDLQMAIIEMKKLSWNGGYRHDIGYRPRYEFTQHLKYILYRYDDYFSSQNKLWAALSGNAAQKCKTLMNLGCSIYQREIDNFIYQLSYFLKHLPFQMSNIHDILHAEGSVKDVYKSGSKGEKIHATTFLDKLYNIDEKRKENLIDNFNHYIVSGSKMSINGAYQFQVLESVNPLTLLYGHVYYNDKIILKNYTDATAFASYSYNPAASNHMIEFINAIGKANVTDTRLENYINGR